jgi:hypothetical protein
MTEQTVVVLGAGATKACGGPLTNDILPEAFRERANFPFPNALTELDQFLIDQFRLKPEVKDRRDKSYPSLPLLLSLLDTAIPRKHALGPAWDTDRLRRVRLATEYAVFALIQRRMGAVKPYYQTLITRLTQATGQPPVLVSLNYDIIADNALIQASQQHHPDVALPDYGCDVATPAYVNGPKWGTLLKLHGSMNWLYCPTCHRLEVGISRSSQLMSIMSRAINLASLDDAYTSGYECRDHACQTKMQPILITPTHLKDYRNPHIAGIWYHAERVLRSATRAIFVGYSLPWDDVDVIYLLKRGLRSLSPQRITVVEYSKPPGQPLDQHDAGQRYMAVFGEDIDWQPWGFETWLTRVTDTMLQP